MKLTLHLEGRKAIRLKMPENPDALHVDVPGEKCPICEAPLQVAGAKKRIGGHDFYTSEAGCIACNAHIGELRLQVSTLFGLKEDETVLRSGVKIY